MFQAPKSPYLVPDDGSLRIGAMATAPPAKSCEEKKNKKKLRAAVGDLDELQRQLYAQDRWSVLLVFQAMDAAGKDSTIRAVLRGINPAGCQVSSFKAPSSRELDHDFLWRSAKRLPQRGRIGVFNRSYYEEVLVVRVHPEYLGGQRLPFGTPSARFWAERFESIADHEKHLARNGTAVIKFFLNVSPQEQRRRFRSRLDEPDKRWKFSAGDLEEAKHWPAYMLAYEQALGATSRSWAPWYVIPADDKPFMRRTVAEILVEALGSLGLSYPEAEIKNESECVELLDRMDGAAPT